MKIFLIFLAIIFVLVTLGCKKAKDAVIETKTITKEYAKGLTRAPGKTRAVTELASLRQAINMYKVENGKFPESLSDLSIKIENIKEYEYNPETGKVNSRHYPKL